MIAFILLVGVAYVTATSEPHFEDDCVFDNDCFVTTDGTPCNPPPADSDGCICKNNKCKISSGCGTMGAFFFRSCRDCSMEDCEDEGTCKTQVLPRGSICAGPDGDPPPTFPLACVTTKNAPCQFPFIYKGVFYDKCTYTDTINNLPWCATVPEVALARNGKVADGRHVGDCDLFSNCEVEDVTGCGDSRCGLTCNPDETCVENEEVACVQAPCCPRWSCLPVTGCGDSRCGLTCNPDETCIENEEVACVQAPCCPRWSCLPDSDYDYEENLGPCTFTHDCRGDGSPCDLIADASCVCNFGRCLVQGHDPGLWIEGIKPRAKQCSTYKDCPCRNETDNCFCIGEQCVNEAWECHDDNECSQHEKCDGKQCICAGGTCEWQCQTTKDCISNNDAFYCQHLGYECKCEVGQCKSVQLEEQCTEPEFGVDDPEVILAGLTTCVDLGLCQRNASCECLQNYCVTPWFAESEEGNCRDEMGVKDCTDNILDCSDGSCICDNVKQITEYRRMGFCKKQ